VSALILPIGTSFQRRDCLLPARPRGRRVVSVRVIHSCGSHPVVPLVRNLGTSVVHRRVVRRRLNRFRRRTSCCRQQGKDSNRQQEKSHGDLRRTETSELSRVRDRGNVLVRPHAACTSQPQFDGRRTNAFALLRTSSIVPQPVNDRSGARTSSAISACGQNNRCERIRAFSANFNLIS